MGIQNIRQNIKDLDKDDVCTIYTIDSLGRHQETNMLTENGLYEVLFTSRKEIAKQFKKWVKDVIKEIRKKGS